MSHLTAERSSSAPWWPAQPAANPHQAAAQVPPGRTGQDGAHLDSLEDVASQRAPGETLESALAAHAKAHPDDGHVQAAVALIAALNQFDLLPPAEAPVIGTAARMLLNEGQARLLCRLAEKRPEHAFALDVGDSSDKVRALARAAANWPAKVSMTIAVCARLPSPSLRALLPLLQRPHKLAIQVVATLSQDAEALLDVLRLSMVLKEGGHRIGRLEMQMANDTPEAAIDCMHRVAAPAFMQMLHLSEVEQLVVHGPLDFVAWVQEMDRYASSHDIARWLESVEAGFLVPAGADVDSALALLAQHKRIVSVSIRPVHTTVQGHGPLEPTAVDRLAFISSANAMARLQATAPNAKAFVVSDEVTEQARTLAVVALVLLLGPEVPLQKLVDHLASPGHCLITPQKVRHNDLDLTSTSLRAKLWVLKRASVDAGLLKAALAAWLRAHPQEIALMLQHLIEVQLLPWQHSATEWQTLGLVFQKSWVVNGGERVGYFDHEHEVEARYGRMPAATAIPVRLPAAGEARWALVQPSTPAGFDALVQLLHDRIQEVHAVMVANPQARNGRDLEQRRDAMVVLLQFLTTGVLLRNPIEAVTCRAIAEELLDLGQGKLLRHLVPAGHTWQFNVKGAGHAAALSNVIPWPTAQSACVVILDGGLSTASLEHAVQFAIGVIPEQLTLSTELNGAAGQPLWNAVARVSEATPGLTLALFEGPAGSSRSDGLRQFFQQHPTLPIGRLSLHDVRDADGQLLPMVVEAVCSWGVLAAELSNCSDALTRGVVACQAWEDLRVTTSRAVADRCLEKAVSAKALRVWLKGKDAQQCAEDMVGSCKKLALVEVIGGPINVVHVARGLDKARSVLAVKFEAAPASVEDERVAAALLKRNPWIIDVRWTPSFQNGVAVPSRVSDHLREHMLLVSNQNLFRESVWFRKGAGKGFGLSLGVRLPSELGSHIGGILDLPSARALSFTNKATYAASQEVWRMEIEWLAVLFAPTVGIEDFVKELNRLKRDWKLRRRPVPTRPNTGDDPVLRKMQCLRMLGLSDGMIGLVLRRSLTLALNPCDMASSNASSSDRAADETRRHTVCALLQGLAYVEGMQPQTWLRMGLGIDVSAPPRSS
ncbi:hypothetical protein [Hydrogenophaga sp.]|uniref:hypothetical protein n=1 Tax=Hydrogenophaga sp. TaxID=1904254 RepID=UPI002719104E|nr:hypothetical protein [Hydrogenophaga sp.]MDO9437193.1 hypothetical protein [Hydrogenophaga sp.]